MLSKASLFYLKKPLVKTSTDRKWSIDERVSVLRLHRVKVESNKIQVDHFDKKWKLKSKVIKLDKSIPNEFVSTIQNHIESVMIYSASESSSISSPSRPREFTKSGKLNIDAKDQDCQLESGELRYSKKTFNVKDSYCVGLDHSTVLAEYSETSKSDAEKLFLGSSSHELNFAITLFNDNNLLEISTSSEKDKREWMDAFIRNGAKTRVNLMYEK
eukprot:TRINITY_DN1069_c0_g1_i1.p1 TRINITY_DN1069_c0_g1~~TRINITY_DN1069_c0_g1_i1.p1  ORF type:complete len:215 (-),score=54.90 TRINITY_DN1069_c0_g1_i1:100-744(-)